MHESPSHVLMHKESVHSGAASLRLTSTLDFQRHACSQQEHSFSSSAIVPAMVGKGTCLH